MAACSRHADHHHDHHHHDPAPGETMVKDPVCGMHVNPANSRHHATHAGAEYLFCSAG
jgi:Cu+-exporting ATPase